MYYMYILVSTKDKNLYIGSTPDLRRRLAEHNAGKVFSTKPRRPFKLVYYEAYLAEKDARGRESALKLRGQARIQLVKRFENSLRQAKS